LLMSLILKVAIFTVQSAVRSAALAASFSTG
jgi:hypothetical protein